MAAEPAAIRTTLTALGVDRQVTREAVTDLLGLSSVGAWVTAMGGDPEQLLDEARKQLRDIRKESIQADPPVPENDRVDIYPKTLAGIKNFASIIDFYVKHGVDADIGLVTDNSRANAIAQFMGEKLGRFVGIGICYHAVREASAANIWKVGFCKGANNIANCLTKILSGTQKSKEVDKWMYRHYE